MTDDELTRTLLDLEHRGWESLRDGSGADFYGALMTEDGVMVLANGGGADRAAVVGSLRGGPGWQRVGIDSARGGTAGDHAGPPGANRPGPRGAGGAPL